MAERHETTEQTVWKWRKRDSVHDRSHTKSVAGLVEKPKAEDAPSNLASIGRHVLTPDIFNILRNQSASAGGEIQLADAINTQAASGAVEAVTFKGVRFDCGGIQGYLNAIVHVADRRQRS